MSDFENAVAAVRTAVADGVEIDDATARTIASLYHSGQASSSYSFASTGAIADSTDIHRDLFPDYAMLESEEKELADALRTYLIRRPIREAIVGWSRLWVSTSACRHEWVAGMMHVADEDLASISAARRVECSKCETVYRTN